MVVVDGDEVEGEDECDIDDTLPTVLATGIKGDVDTCNVATLPTITDAEPVNDDDDP